MLSHHGSAPSRRDRLGRRDPDAGAFWCAARGRPRSPRGGDAGRPSTFSIPPSSAARDGEPAEVTTDGPLFRDSDEWPGTRYHRGDEVLHIEFRKWADLFIVAPLDANTLAKFALGISDNFLSCIFRAWDFAKPVILAPAMNTLMWDSPVTLRHLRAVTRGSRGRAVPAGWTLDDAPAVFARHAPEIILVPPQAKRLACGDVGVGAMAEVTADRRGRSAVGRKGTMIRDKAKDIAGQRPSYRNCRREARLRSPDLASHGWGFAGSESIIMSIFLSSSSRRRAQSDPLGVSSGTTPRACESWTMLRLCPAMLSNFRNNSSYLFLAAQTSQDAGC